MYIRRAVFCLVINGFGCTSVPITVSVSGRDRFTILMTVGQFGIYCVQYIRRAAFCLVINGFGCTRVPITVSVSGRDRFTMLLTVGQFGIYCVH